jgi:hypothetical protein
MIIVLKPSATTDQAREILARIEALGLRPLHMLGTERVVLGAIGDERVLETLHLDSHPAVESVQRVLAPWNLVSCEFHPLRGEHLQRRGRAGRRGEDLRAAIPVAPGAGRRDATFRRDVGVPPSKFRRGSRI